MSESPRTYKVQARDREPLVAFMLEALRDGGCRLIEEPKPDSAPFRILFELPNGERMGIVAYAFFANQALTKNRPADEYRFQLKYGTKDDQAHELWQDPSGLYTTVLCGINPTEGVFVGADPVLHSPTRMFISIAFKQEHVERALQLGWHIWERELRRDEDPVEVLVGGTRSAFLRYVLFEREAYNEDQGHRHRLAERTLASLLSGSPIIAAAPTDERLHALSVELDLTPDEIMDMIRSAPYLKRAVRGTAAEKHLFNVLKGVPDVTHIEHDRGSDIVLRFRGVPLNIECKNVLWTTLKNGLPRVDFQRTRTSKADPCSRFYSPSDFHIVAACLHARTSNWEFRFALSSRLDAHRTCLGKLSSNVQVDRRWSADASQVLAEAASAE